MKTTEKKEPEIKLYGIPIWCHHHCGKMGIEKTESSLLKLAGSAAFLEIVNPTLFSGKRYCKVLWEILFAVEEKVNGQVLFSDAHLRAAFGLSNEMKVSSDWLLEKYGGDVAAQGCFIRYQQFLNIPGPGTGNDGDPNISIENNEEMKNAIAALLLTKSVAN